jgi:hypothetical protein
VPICTPFPPPLYTGDAHLFTSYAEALRAKVYSRPGDGFAGSACAWEHMQIHSSSMVDVRPRLGVVSAIR